MQDTTTPDDELDRIILESLSSDFEPFESLVSGIIDRRADSRAIFSVDQIRLSLLRSIANRLVGAYIIHAEPPFVSSVCVSLETVDTRWFYVTEEGRRYLRALVERQATMVDKIQGTS